MLNSKFEYSKFKILLIIINLTSKIFIYFIAKTFLSKKLKILSLFKFERTRLLNKFFLSYELTKIRKILSSNPAIFKTFARIVKKN